MDLQNNLGSIRKKRGFSVAQVAKAVDISRQTVYAIEASSFIPNTVVALKLARLFGVTVEDLFPPEKESPPVHTEEVTALLPGVSVRVGQPLQLCRVSGRLVAAPPEPGIWGLPTADAIVMDHPGTKQLRKTRVQHRRLRIGNLRSGFCSQVVTPASPFWHATCVATVST